MAKAGSIERLVILLVSVMVRSHWVDSFETKQDNHGNSVPVLAAVLSPGAVVSEMVGKTRQTIHNELLSTMLATNHSVRLDTPPTCTHLLNYTAVPVAETDIEGNEDVFRSELIVITELQFEQILGVDERLKRITCRMVISLHWRDCRFMWAPEDWANIQEIHVTDLRTNRIYLPCIFLRETLESDIEWRIGRTLHVWHNGLLSLPVRTDVMSSCNIDTYLYPFDVQECTLTFEAPEDSIRTLALTTVRDSFRHEREFLEAHGGPHLDNYVPSDHWQFIGHEHYLSNFTDSTGNETYSRVTHRFRIRRHPGYHLVNVVFPCVITMLVSSFVFVIPPGTSDKVSLCLSILLSLVVFTQLMFDRMPETGSTLPMISQYFLFCNGSVAIAFVASVVNMVIMNKGDERSTMPSWMRTILSMFGRLVAPQHFKRMKSTSIRVNSGRGHEVVVEIDGKNHSDVRLSPPNGAKLNDWMLFALVLDRLFFLLHLGTTLTILLVYLVTAYGTWLNSVQFVAI